MRRKLASPLPQRDGLDAVRVRLPADGPWRTVRDHLVDRLPMVGAERIDGMFGRGEFVGLDGPIPADAPFVPRLFVWFYRELPAETPVPFEVAVLHRDESVLVADKPHFLATTPRGSHVAETALVRLRRDWELPELSPAHRLDRMTAGLVLFVTDPRHRGAYQTLFQNRLVHKEYEAIAPFDPGLALPRTVRARIRKERGVLAAQQVPGEPNSETRVELIERRGGLGRYRLVPRTGRTHQLRLHMHLLGVPILGDALYPSVTEAEDFTRPLQLLARSLRFTDPITGEPRSWESGRELAAWTAPADWGG